MKLLQTILFFLVLSVCKSQPCETGKLDPRISAALIKIGDLQPGLDTVSIEQAKQEKLDHYELPSTMNVIQIKITRDSIPVYIFNASGKRDLPGMLYFHPGGFVTPFLPFMKYDCWKMSRDLNAIVFAVDYRISPAFRFPAALNDAYNSFEWLLTNCEKYGCNKNQLILAGMSAGANLAAVVCHRARNKGLATKIKLQILNCPSVDNYKHQSKYPSYSKYSSGYFQTRAFIEFAQKLYCDEKDLDNPEFSPILSDNFKALPPTVMITAEFDIMRDEELAYVEKLQNAGVKVWHHCFAGQIHCLVGLPDDANEFFVLNELMKRAMREVF